MLMNYRLLEFSSINCLRLWRKPEYQEKTTDLWQVDWQTLLQNDVSTTPRYEPGSPLCIVYVPNQKSVLRVSILPLSTIILVDLGNIPTVVFFVFHLFQIKLLPMYYRFLNSDLFLIEDTKKSNIFTFVVTEAKTKDRMVVFLYICLFLSSDGVDNHIRYFYCDTCEACKSVKFIHYLSEL
jgi:hypothetical protein